jgi:hypothetical protein
MSTVRTAQLAQINMINNIRDADFFLNQAVALSARGIAHVIDHIAAGDHAMHGYLSQVWANEKPPYGARVTPCHIAALLAACDERDGNKNRAVLYSPLALAMPR